MTLNWIEIGLRFPDAVVLWDRDVAPTLDWEPRFRYEAVAGKPGYWFDLILFAETSACDWRGCKCDRCLRWDGRRWLAYRDWRFAFPSTASDWSMLSVDLGIEPPRHVWTMAGQSNGVANSAIGMYTVRFSRPFPEMPTRQRLRGTRAQRKRQRAKQQRAL